MEDCSICHSELKDAVYMTCSSKHPFCFGCILKSVETSKELKSCPLCRGGDKYILIDSTGSESSDFYSLDYLRKSIPILQKVLKLESSNTCLVSDKVLISYIKNKKQLEMAHILLASHELAEVISSIKWNRNDTTEELGSFLTNVASEVFFGTQYDPPVYWGSYARRPQ